jgi:hypothetical protein
MHKYRSRRQKNPCICKAFYRHVCTEIALSKRSEGISQRKGSGIISNKTKRINIRLTPKEFKQIEKLCKQEKLTKRELLIKNLEKNFK